jgi:DNA-directed RNA polymerase subunit omega
MRLEQIVSKALKQVNNDNYVLSLMVSQRANELSNGSEPLIDMKKNKNLKYTDIALMEIAKGVIKLDTIEQK